MLAGCSQALLSERRHLDFQLEEKMSTQRFDLPRSSVPRRDVPRIACSFRQSSSVAASSSSSAIATQNISLRDAKKEVEEAEGWNRGHGLKRFYDWSSSEEDSSCIDKRAKRKRTGIETELVGGGGGSGGREPWIPHSVAEHSVVGDEKAYFVPSANLFTNALLRPFGAEENNGAGTSAAGMRGKMKWDSGTSKDAHSSSPRPERSPEHETRNGSRNIIPYSSGLFARTEEDQGFQLLNLLTSCVDCFSSGSHGIINHLARLGELASPFGSPIHRLAAYLTEAFAICVVKLWPHIFSVTLPRDFTDQLADEDAVALRLLDQVSPIPKFIHFTINERLFRAFEGKDRVHIIDFNIKQGLQWPSLFQSLASRPNPPSHVRITGIGESKLDLVETGSRLANIAEELNLPFEFHPVVDRLEDVRLWMLHVKEGECVAVNCVLQLHKTLYDESCGVLRDFLGLIRSTNPSIVLLAEEEAEHNDAMLEKRFSNSIKYYSAVFDMVDASLPAGSAARLKIEEMFAGKIRNIVACEGIERVERHEKFDIWQTMMQRAGFSNVGMSERERIQGNMLIRMYSGENFYSIEKKGEEPNVTGLTLKWLDQPLYTVSAWAPSEIGSSPSASKPG